MQAHHMLCVHTYAALQASYGIFGKPFLFLLSLSYNVPLLGVYYHTVYTNLLQPAM